MILPFQQIIAANLLSPMIIANVNPHSVNLTIGDSVAYLPDGYVVDTKNIKNLPFTHEKISEKGFFMKKNKTYLFTTKEYVQLPDTIKGQILARSSAARAGINHLNAGLIDAGFCGEITLELVATNDTIIYAGQSYVQIEFCLLSERTETPYRGVYQHQVGVTTPLNKTL